ncbi:MAG: biopolymer transporter ExbD [Pseudomonadota bacterium]
MRRARRRAKRLSMTSLIDVIFLLLLFFMLSSTFSRFAEVDLVAGGTGAPAAGAPSEVLFLRLTDSGASLNGRALELDALEPALRAQPGTALIISVTTSATAQILTDTLVAVRGVPDLQMTVLEGR